jgi:alpha-beta hydrolase superfamily lysophospholipase
MQASDFSCRASSGIDLFVSGWLPDGAPRAIVQISHGMQEYGARYAPTAEALCAAGFAVYAGDHRGHGRSLIDGRLGHLGSGGWRTVLCDLRQVTEQVRARHSGLPLFLLGHS